MVEEPWLLVSGLLHESDCPTLLGSVAFSRATLSKTIWLSEGARPGPKFPPNGMTWACAATGTRTHTASAADKQCGNRSGMHLSFTFSQLVVSGVYAVHKEFDNRAAGNRVVVGRCRCG